MAEKKYRLKSIDDVRRFLAKITNELNNKKHADSNEVTRYRALGYLCNQLLSAIKDSDFEIRLKQLEDKLNEAIN